MQANKVTEYLNRNINLNNTKSKLTNVTRGALPLVIDYVTQHHQHPTLIITTDPMLTEHLQREQPFYNPNINFLPFPDWETLPYDTFSPNDEISSQRIETLYKLSTANHAVTCIPLTTALYKICPVPFIKQHSLNLKVKDKMDLIKIRKQLIEYGYTNVAEVSRYGEFSIKGSLIDIYPSGSELPYRIDLFDDEVDSIRTFDPETQRSIQKINSIKLLPAHEFPLTEEAIKTFRHNWRNKFAGNPINSNIYQNISHGLIPSGIEYFIPLFFEQMQTIFDYLDKNALIIIINSQEQDIHNLIEDFLNNAKNRYINYNIDSNNPLLPPEDLFLQSNDFFSNINNFKQLEINFNNTSTKSWHNTLSIDKINDVTNDITIDKHLKDPLTKLKSHINTHLDFKYLICAESLGRFDSILSFLKDHEINDIKKLNHEATWQDFLSSDAKLNLGIGRLDNGFIIQECKLAVITEAELYSNKIQQRRLRKRKDISSENIIKNLAELKPNQYIVHQQHGIGKYLGLESITVNQITNDYLSLLYADNSKIYVPVTSLEQISRYNGLDQDNIQLTKLGNKSWSQAKEKAFKKIKDAAADLLAIYAKRSAQQGFVYQINKDEYEKFCSNFRFEETPDQQLAINQVIKDMQNPASMDRLICGDVGFGKTEVALRAAFIASTNNMQVALLVPTTLLAQQHYENFKDRFAEFPINIELLSRFKTSKEQQATLKKIEAGTVDIIIGTHKIIQDSIKFRNLGLLIIDEEHRFGVGQKEKIKKLRANIDILTLTATPIPRTLNLSLTGIRDLSIITTPPQKRLAIKTFLKEKSKELIVEAISRELKRGGQIYYLHNNVKTIDHVFNEISELFPDIKTAVAHGQMRERELEKIMSDFYHRKYQILICTTIIETGIDVPSANTIIIDRADKLGLAQLHQLRGRVGRSHHQAYAYLFTPRGAKISPDAEKRLEAISSLENLGAGFTLASHDMEIRGTGNLLGEEQSGYIEAIGYNLYMELLNKALKSLKEGKNINLIDIDDLEVTSCEVDLKVSALFPNDFIPDLNQRLILYKRIASAISEDELNELKLELSDRFGKLPIEVDNLFISHLIKLKATKLKITKIDIGSKSGKIKFDKEPNINHTNLIGLIQKQPNQYKLASNDTLNFYFPMEKLEDKYNTINNILEKLVG